MAGPLRLLDSMSVEVALDYYLIAFFTTYLDAGFDVSAAAAYEFELGDAVALRARAEVTPQFLVARGRLEIMTKLELGVGVVYDVP